MTNRLMETACARLCLLTPIAWDESMPPLFSRMAVRRMMECGALSGLVLRRTDMLPQATFERAEMLLTRTSDALLCLEAYEKQGYRLILPESREWPKALRALGGREPLFLFMREMRRCWSGEPLRWRAAERLRPRQMTWRHGLAPCWPKKG